MLDGWHHIPKATVPGSQWLKLSEGVVSGAEATCLAQSTCFV